MQNTPSSAVPRALLFLAMLASTSGRTVPAAEVFQVTPATRDALPGGKEADGIIGDWILRNDRVVAVIGQPGDWRDANQMVEGVQGAVIDFTTVEDDNDQLVVFHPMGYRPTGVSANRAEIAQHRGTFAQLEVIRDATGEEPYTSHTIYTLHDGEAFLRVTTIHENTTASPLEIPVHDWLRLDNNIAGRQARGDQTVILLENKWYGAAYGVASNDGRTQRANRDLDQKDLRAVGTHVHYPAINPEQRSTVVLEPGVRIEIDRLLLVARDTAGVQAAALRARGRTPPLTRLRALDHTGAPVADVFVDVTRGDEFVTSAISRSDGALDLPLEDGTYALTATQIGRPTLTRELSLQSRSPRESEALVLGPLSQVTLDITEAGTGTRMPVKVEFRARDGGPPPNLGPNTRAEGAGILFFSARGQDTFAVPPGDYLVHVSRGPEYEVLVRKLVVTPGASFTLTAALRREITSPHWIIADLHNHSTDSGDSGVEPAGRVLNLAGAGIEFAPATEHNRISSYASTIRALELESFIASCPGIELSGRPGPSAINHQNAFPLEIRDDRQGGGAPRTDANPFVQMQRLLELDDRSPKLMQHNHPDIGWLYFDRDRDGVHDGGFGTRTLTDVMEIRETMLEVLAETDPAATRHRSRVFHWLQMLNQGDRVFGTANTDSHTVGHENGSIFNYVHLEHDDVARLDPWEVARSVKRGRAVMSNGPFLEVSIDDALPGDMIVARSDEVRVRIKVQQASWSRIDRVQVLVNGRQLDPGNFTREKDPGRFADGIVQFEHAFTIKLDADAHIIVVAAGEHETIGRRVGGKFAKNIPMAMSNPIFVDHEGNGFHANGDTLGAPLPDGRPRGPGFPPNGG